MGTCLVKLKNKYVEWSSISDSPITYGMTEQELKEYLKNKYGSEGIRDIESRLARCSINGTSRFDYKIEDFVNYNRAGKDETCLDLEHLCEQYKCND